MLTINTCSEANESFRRTSVRERERKRRNSGLRLRDHHELNIVHLLLVPRSSLLFFHAFFQTFNVICLIVIIIDEDASLRTAICDKIDKH